MWDDFQREQLEISSCLRIIPLLDRPLVRYPILELPPVDSLTEKEKAVRVLNWVSLFFVSNPGDCYAACLSYDDDGDDGDDGDDVFPTLHIASSEWSAGGTPTDVESAKAECLLEMIDVLTRGKRTAWSAHEKLDYVYRNLVDHCWHPVWTRIQSVRSAILEANREDRLFALLDSWIDHREKYSTISGAPITSEYREETKKKVASLFDDLMDIREPFLLKHPEGGSVFAQLGYIALRDASATCAKLAKVDFFRCFHPAAAPGDQKPGAHPSLVPPWTCGLDAQDTATMRTVVRAIQEGVEYAQGAALFASVGLRYFGAMLADTPPPSAQISEALKIAWVNNLLALALAEPRPSALLAWAETPREYAAFVRGTGVGNRVRVADAGQEGALRARCADAWAVGAAASAGARVYADVRVGLYMRRRGLRVVEGAIGVSEPPCRCSASFLAGMGCAMRELSPYVRQDWLLPPGLESDIHREEQEREKEERSSQDQDQGPGQNKWVLDTVGLVVKDARRELGNVIDAFLVDHKAAHLSDDAYQKKARYSKKSELAYWFVVPYEQWEPRFY